MFPLYSIKKFFFQISMIFKSEFLLIKEEGSCVLIIYSIESANSNHNQHNSNPTMITVPLLALTLLYTFSIYIAHAESDSKPIDKAPAAQSRGRQL